MRVCLLTCAVVATSILGGACSKAKSPTEPSANAVVVHVIRENGAQSFNPNPAAAGGKPVVFKNDDTVTHRVVLNDGSIDTGDIAPGATSTEVTMPSDGTNYHCSIHPSMIGSVSAASGAPPPECTGLYCE
ncbi:MAG: hypothetical protein IT184_18550 [Acidobacteria bacterium]|nr:hypothetical protein [Acidobacteriota bacterium]